MEVEVLPHRQLTVERVLLGDDPDQLLGQRGMRDDVDRADERGAGGRYHARGEHPGGRRLAGAVGPEQPEDLAGADAQVEGVDGREVGARVDLRQLDRADHLARSAPSPSPIAWCGGRLTIARRGGHRPQSIALALPSAGAMADTGKIAKNLERFAQAVAAHDRENPTHTAYGIGLAHFDMERLGLDEGEEILPGITIHADSGVTGNFRVLCDGEHEEELTEAEEQAVEAIATQAIPAYSPARSPFEAQ